MTEELKQQIKEFVGWLRRHYSESKIPPEYSDAYAILAEYGFVGTPKASGIFVPWHKNNYLPIATIDNLIENLDNLDEFLEKVRNEKATLSKGKSTIEQLLTKTEENSRILSEVLQHVRYISQAIAWNSPEKAEDAERDFLNRV